MRCALQSVKKASNRQNANFDDWGLSAVEESYENPKRSNQGIVSFCCAKPFDFLRKPLPTVFVYADGRGLLALAAPLTSGSLSKKEFFDKLKSAPRNAVRSCHVVGY